MGHQVSLPEPIWQKLLVSWIGFFAVMGALNLYVAYNFSLDTWVDFKMFGGIGLMLLFVIAQGLFLAKHVQDQNT
jgi:intracellular septation protein